MHMDDTDDDGGLPGHFVDAGRGKDRAAVSANPSQAGDRVSP